MLALPAVLLAGCGTFEGTYSPNCVAYAGDRITLDAGSFVWEKFTDAIPVDAAGNPEDPHPGYPLRGTYEGPGGILEMRSESGDALEAMHIHWDDGAYFLLTEAQLEQLDASGELAECALIRGGFDAGN